MSIFDRLFKQFTENQKALEEQMRTWTNQQLTFNEALLQQQKGLLQQKEPTIFTSVFITPGVGATEVAFISPSDKFRLHHIDLAFTANTAALIERLYNGKTVRMRRTRYITSHTPPSWDFGKIGIPFPKGAALQIQSSAAASIEVNASWSADFEDLGSSGNLGN